LPFSLAPEVRNEGEPVLPLTPGHVATFSSLRRSQNNLVSWTLTTSCPIPIPSPCKHSLQAMFPLSWRRCRLRFWQVRRPSKKQRQPVHWWLRDLQCSPFRFPRSPPARALSCACACFPATSCTGVMGCIEVLASDLGHGISPSVAAGRVGYYVEPGLTDL